MRFTLRKVCAVMLGGLMLASCSQPAPKLSVAVAANLTGVFEELEPMFRQRTGIAVSLSFGSTAQLSQQIENGAPFDVFAAADTTHIDQLIASGKIVANSRAVFARGQLAVWVPTLPGIRTLQDLADPSVRFIAIAQPELAPYGSAAVEALKAAELWDQLQPKLVYATNVNLARQYAATGNADAAFTAYSLVLKDPGTIVKVDPAFYAPIDQALGVLSSSTSPQAREFVAFLAGSEGRAILKKHGYLVR